MVASEFLGYVQSFSVCNYVGFEDLADRANFQWNVIVLLLCMVLVTMRQYFMTPLVCYLPTTVSGVNADSYITNLCWIEGTFPINLTSGIVPHKLHEWDALRPQQMNYYQWVPLVLGLQAILYYLPRIIWSIFTYNRTGTDLQNLIRQANLIAKEDGEKRQKMVQHIAKTLELLLFSRREYRSTDTLTASFRRSMAFMPDRFMAEFLRQDGHFILRMLSMNAGDLITVEIVCNLFADYKKRFAGIDFRGPPLMPKMHKYHDFDGYLSSHRSHDIPNDIPRSVNNDRNPPGFIRLEEGGIANVRQRPTPSAPVVSENAVPPAYQYAAGMKDPEIYPLSVVRNMPRDAPVEQSKNVMNAPKLIDDNITVNEKEQLKRLPQYTPTEV
ncbi:Innexin unc-9 [Schistosoma japonicum]|uniref:Innexin n=1 Tax=Schistosoma japonicum TaxID=6182 RepID=A0A4Z2D2H2_SCHJA|nr:Innexin unc-9 [Schistosoma japonicum]